MPGLVSRFATGKIRQLVVFGMILALLSFFVLGGMAYSHLVQIEEALGLAEAVDDLSDTILEIRRYEKNYLLYALEEDYQETIAYNQRARDVIARVGSVVRGGGVAEKLGRNSLGSLREHLGTHSVLFDNLHALQGAGDADRVEALRLKLREQGKVLTEEVRRFVGTQRERILDSVGALKQQLVVSVASFTALALIFSWLVGRRILGALSIIEQSARQIVQGNFEPLTEPRTSDETQGVVVAFNHMIEELDRRQNQLLQEKKLASLGVLTSGIAHQLNNPLNNISTSCQIVREDMATIDVPDAELYRQMLDNIYQEVSRSRDIVKGLLDFSRETEFCLKVMPLAVVVNKAVALVSSETPTGVTISTRIPESLRLPLDSQRFQEVLINLLLNAIHAMTPPGTITLVGHEDTEERLVVLEVCDTGCGIAPEDLGRIFDPFFTRKESGTGLGLAIGFGIIKKHGGTISVTSELGQGTCFTIRLPLAGESQS